MTTEVFEFADYEKFATNPQSEKGLRNIGKTKVVSVFSKPSLIELAPSSNSSIDVSTSTASSLLQFFMPSAGYMLTWEGYVPKLVFTVENPSALPIIVNPMFAIQRTNQFVNNNSFSGRFNDVAAYTRDCIMDTPLDQIQTKLAGAGIPCTGVMNRPYLDTRAETSVDLLPDGTVGTDANSPSNPGYIAGLVDGVAQSRTFSIPLDYIADGLLADKDAIPLPLSYMNYRIEFTFKPTVQWVQQIEVAGTPPVAVAVKLSGAYLRFWRTTLPSDLDRKVAGLIERGILNIHTICACTTAVGITFAENSQTQYQVNGLPLSVRFVNQHIESNAAINDPRVGHCGLTSVDFGIKAYQHIIDGSVIEAYPVRVQKSLEAFDTSTDNSYLLKKVFREYTKISNTSVSPSIYSGFGGRGLTARGYYPTNNLSADDSEPGRLQFDRMFRMSLNLQSANEDIYSGTKINSSFTTLLSFGSNDDRSLYYTATDNVDDETTVAITTANMVHVFYSNAEVTIGLSRAEIIV